MPRLKHQRAVDAIVGDRIRVRRLLLGMSQTDLGDKLGMSFQQVQKYERGASRITVSLLVELSSIFDVPLTFFLDGIDANQTKELPDDRAVLTVARYFKETHPEVQGAVVSLLAALGGKGKREEGQGEGQDASEIAKSIVTPAPAAVTPVPAPEIPLAPAPVSLPEPVANDPAPKSSNKQPRRRKWGAVWDPTDIRRSKV